MCAYDLMYFEESDTFNDYYLALTENGQVYYSVTDDTIKPNVEWKLVSVDEKTLSVIH